MKAEHVIDYGQYNTDYLRDRLDDMAFELLCRRDFWEYMKQYHEFPEDEKEGE